MKILLRIQLLPPLLLLITLANLIQRLIHCINNNNSSSNNNSSNSNSNNIHLMEQLHRRAKQLLLPVVHQQVPSQRHRQYNNSSQHTNISNINSTSSKISSRLLQSRPWLKASRHPIMKMVSPSPCSASTRSHSLEHSANIYVPLERPSPGRNSWEEIQSLCTCHPGRGNRCLNIEPRSKKKKESEGAQGERKSESRVPAWAQLTWNR